MPVEAPLLYDRRAEVHSCVWRYAVRKYAMPLQLLHRTFEPSADTAGDVRARFEWGLALSQASSGRVRYEKSVRDLADYFYYVGAVCSEYARPLQQAFVTATDTQLANFAFTFPTWLYLLLDAPNECVDILTRRLAADNAPPTLRFTLESMLAAVCTPAALSALADYARERGRISEFSAIGFWIPPASGAAVPRFTPQRLAARVRRDTEHPPANFCHPVGLPLSEIMADPDQDVVTWHYCSLGLADLAGAPPLPASRVHLVSPPLWNEWTVYCSLASDGLYSRPLVVSESSDEVAMGEDALADQLSNSGELLLLPYDDQLIYSTVTSS